MCAMPESEMEDLIGRAMEQNFVPVVDDQEHFIGMITRRRYYQILLRQGTGV